MPIDFLNSMPPGLLICMGIGAIIGFFIIFKGSSSDDIIELGGLAIIGAIALALGLGLCAISTPGSFVFVIGIFICIGGALPLAFSCGLFLLLPALGAGAGAVIYGISRLFNGFI